MLSLSNFFGYVSVLRILLSEFLKHPWTIRNLSKSPYFTIEILESIISIKGTRLLDWHSVSYNPNIRMDYVTKNPQLPWNWYGLTKNPSVTMDYIESHPELPWKYDILSNKSNLTEKYIESHSEIYWDWFTLANNPNLSVSFREKNLEKIWHLKWSDIERDPVLSFADDNTVSMDFVTKHLDYNWNWDNISEHPSVTMEYIIANPKLPWVWECVSMNPNVTMDHINSHPDLPWNWECVSMNPNLTMEFLGTNIEKSWDWMSISLHPNLTMDFVSSHLDKDWMSEGICKNPTLTLEFIEKHIHRDWDFFQIGANPNIAITEQFIEEFIEKYKTHDQHIGDLFEGLSNNPNLNPKFIKRFHEMPWDWSALSLNSFEYENNKINKTLLLKEGFRLLEQERTFHKLLNLHVVKKYM